MDERTDRMWARCPEHLNEDDSAASPHLVPGAAPAHYRVNSFKLLTAVSGYGNDPHLAGAEREPERFKSGV